jgi:tRNA A22 N-methylase
MSRVEEIKEAIDTLPEEEYIQLRQWLSEKDWQKWDQQIVVDSETKKLDFLLKEEEG